ncbi:SMP-30/gluconolactonase/LRE family protein [Blastococcus haudaquaticus]|uniref:Sugar lactone lactonase YvrE n=1 Tax=Blastococcus haudaquaticus TaxID=1938745 RepID=A0A286GU40_9ACTN|nr:SMP-30/gluconolactonase/LRE family protein [Blastococcus haudaquaticus]SOD98494.1 Sugar lactone lactonase YvrE [Blastococcus haudaquaticus]
MTRPGGFAAVQLFPVAGHGAEDVLVDPAGQVLTGVEDGRILRLDPSTGDVETVATVPGRPLGLELLGAGELLVCSSDAGLLAVPTAGGTARTLVDRFEGRRLGAVNNAAVAADGTIYFSDSSTRFPIPQWRADLVQRSRSGRLLRRDPDGAVTQLLGGLEFANGVALSADGSFVAVAETGARRIRRVWLDGPRRGTDDVLADELWGYPDNIALGSDGLIWVAVASPRVAALDTIWRLPSAARAVVRRLPERLQPSPDPVVGLVALDGDGRVVEERRGLLDGFGMLTGVRESGGTLWLGSLTADSVASLPR